MINRKHKLAIGLGFSLVFALVAGIPLTTAHHLQNRTEIAPAPTEPLEHTSDFPLVDWDYLWTINSDIVGWITVPGTTINHPIVQARPEDPSRYLSHDIYGDWNPWGAIYLSSECIEHGLDSQNRVIYGHNMGGEDLSQFGPLRNYSDEDWARSHMTILLQTPQWKEKMTVSAVGQAAGWEATKRTDFLSNHDFSTWYSERYTAARINLKEENHSPTNTYTLVTCSYVYESDERILVYAD